jgi:hypothetical protein
MNKKTEWELKREDEVALWFLQVVLTEKRRIMSEIRGNNLRI